MRALKPVLASGDRMLLAVQAGGAVLMALFVLFALWTLSAPLGGAEPMRVQQVTGDAASESSLAKVAARLRKAPAVRGALDLPAAGSTTWVRIEVPARADGQAQLLHLSPARLRLQRLAVIEPGGAALTESRLDPRLAGPLSDTEGLTLQLPPSVSGVTEVFAQFVANRAGRVRVAAWPAEQFEVVRSHRTLAEGALFGALALVALVSLAVSVIARRATFVHFAGMLLSGLALAGMTAPGTVSWMGTGGAALHGPVAFDVAAAMYAAFSCALFWALFDRELRTAGLRPLGSATVAAGLVLAGLAVAVAPTRVPALALGYPAAVLALVAFAAVNIRRSAPPALFHLFGFGALLALTAIGFEASRTLNVFPDAADLAAVRHLLIPATLLIAVAVALDAYARPAGRRGSDDDAGADADLALGGYAGAPVGLLSLDEEGRVLRYNLALADLMGLPAVPMRPEEQRTLDSIFGPGTMVELSLLLVGGQAAEVEVATGSGELRRWFRIRASRTEQSIQASVEDITERMATDFQLRYLAHHDPLTALLNRRGFDLRYQQALQMVREGKPVLIAYLDLDRFKLVNDMFGHTAGDHVLKQVAERLRVHVPPPHSIARVGGDEFLVLFFDLTVQEAKRICTEILREVRSSPYHYQDKAFSVDGSMGLTRVEPNLSERDAIVTCDRACAEAKRAGGSQVVVLSEDSEAVREQLAEIRLIEGIRGEAPESRLFTMLQPIIALRNPADSLCYEVLLRMRDEDGMPLVPGRFIKAAERNGLITRFDRWVLTQTLRWLDANPAHRDRITFATLNISGASLNDERFVADVHALLREHAKAAHRLCFEITESVALYDLNVTRRFIDVVKGYGSRLALDDFGAGYTSFAYLKELGGDIVKIDGSFVRDINANPANFAITRAIVDVSHELGMDCIAEWAETDGILRSLMLLDVDYAQGFALSKPLEPTHLLHAPHCAALIADPIVAGLLTVDRGAEAPPPVRLPRSRFAQTTA